MSDSLSLPPPSQVGATPAVPAAPFLISDTQVGTDMEPWDLNWLRQLELCCKRLETQSSAWVWVQSTGDGELVGSNKRMHEALEALKPPLLPTAVRRLFSHSIYTTERGQRTMKSVKR